MLLREKLFSLGTPNQLSCARDLLFSSPVEEERGLRRDSELCGRRILYRIVVVAKER